MFVRPERRVDARGIVKEKVVRPRLEGWIDIKGEKNVNNGLSVKYIQLARIWEPPWMYKGQTTANS